MGIIVAGVEPHRRAVALALVLMASRACPMGGHFDVDDAAVLAPGRCQIELWSVRGESLRVLHAGPACRVGPVELGLTVDRLSNDEQHDHIVGAQLKAVAGWLPQVDVGLVVSALRDTTRGVNLATAYVPLTWSPSASVQLHSNLGVDRTGDGRHTRRFGVAGEWAPDERVTLLVERLYALGAVVSRVGLRVALGEQTHVDFSAARLSGSGNRLWGLGWTWEFGH